MIRAAVFIVVLALGAWGISSVSFTVAPDSVAVVKRGDKAVRVEQPGLRWRVPFLETVGFVPVFRQYRQLVTIDARLEDGSACRVTAHLHFRLENAVRALAWREKHGAPDPSGTQDDGQSYTEAARAFQSAAASAYRSMKPQDARQGAMTRWIRDYSAGAHEDGTRVLFARAQAVSCEAPAQAPVAQPLPKRQPPVFGELKAFTRSMARPDSAGVPVQDLILQAEDLILRDGRRARFEALPVRFRVTDAARFSAAFGTSADRSRIAAARLTTMLAAELRKAVSALDAGALTTFDPLSLAAQDTTFAKQLDGIGIQLVDIGGQQAGYRLTGP